MLAALLTTLLFATSAICGYRTARQVGGVEANFWRITLATIFLTVWAFTFGRQFAGAPGWFMLSGFFGIGLGDSAYFQALPRLGSRRTVLLSQCLTAPFAGSSPANFFAVDPFLAKRLEIIKNFSFFRVHAPACPKRTGESRN